MVEKRRGLGRGLGALIPSSAPEALEAEVPPQTATPRRPGRPVDDVFFPSGSESGTSDATEAGPKNRSGVNKGAPTAKKDMGEKPRQGAAAKGAGSGVAESERLPDGRPSVEAADEKGGAAAPTGPDTESTARGSVDVAHIKSPETESVSRETLAPVPGARFAEIPVGSIHPNRKQPRNSFDETDMAELIHSIREIGVLQPIVVRPSQEAGDREYELVMGERRWRATQEAGLELVPAIIRSTGDDALLRDALLENLHRSQLNPLEEAAAYRQLLDDFGCSHEELAERIGRSRPQISNMLRLMNLPPLVQRRLAAGVLSAGHARALLALEDPAEMEKLAQKIVAEGLSVRATEEIVAMSDGLRRATKPAKPRAGARHERLDYLASSLSDRLDTSVKITLGARKGRVSIEFATVDDLNRIMGVLSRGPEPTES